MCRNNINVTFITNSIAVNATGGRKKSRKYAKFRRPLEKYTNTTFLLVN